MQSPLNRDMPEGVDCYRTERNESDKSKFMKRNRYSKNIPIELHQLKLYLSQVRAVDGSEALVSALLKRIADLERALEEMKTARDQRAA